MPEKRKAPKNSKGSENTPKRTRRTKIPVGDGINHIAKVPEDVLKIILGHVPNLCQVARVCKLWRNIAKNAKILTIYNKDPLLFDPVWTAFILFKMLMDGLAGYIHVSIKLEKWTKTMVKTTREMMFEIRLLEDNVIIFPYKVPWCNYDAIKPIIKRYKWEEFGNRWVVKIFDFIKVADFFFGTGENYISLSANEPQKKEYADKMMKLKEDSLFIDVVLPKLDNYEEHSLPDCAAYNFLECGLEVLPGVPATRLKTIPTRLEYNEKFTQEIASIPRLFWADIK